MVTQYLLIADLSKNGLSMVLKYPHFLVFILFLHLAACNGSSTDSTPQNAPPIFTSGNTINVAENTAVTGYTATVGDSDGDVITYSLKGGADQAAFSVGSSSGVLLFLSSPDFETPTDSDTNNTYVIQISASDGSGSISQTVTVTVTNLNDNNPIFTSGTAINVAENNTATGYTADATDGDGDTVTYSLTGGVDQAAFSINSSSGVLSFQSAPDYEAQGDNDSNNSYLVEITAFDGLNTETQSLVVSVINLAENPPGTLMGSGIQGSPLSLTADVTTLAGDYLDGGHVDGTGSAASFPSPSGITTDGTYLYVAEQNGQSIRQVNIATAEVATIAGTAFNWGYSDGPGTDALFNSPFDLTTDGTNLYVADVVNRVIRQIDIATGVVGTIAGTQGTIGSADGVGTAAQFSYPYGITTDGTYLYVTENGNHTIRKIEISTGTVTTLSGTVLTSGSNDGIGTAASFYIPYGITTDGINLYVADLGNSTIRKVIIATGEVSTLAGSAGLTGIEDGVGTEARFNGPMGITTDGTNLYVTDHNNHSIRKIVIATSEVTTIAGSGGISGYLDANGTDARFMHPNDLTSDGISLFVTGSNTIRQID